MLDRRVMREVIKFKFKFDLLSNFEKDAYVKKFMLEVLRNDRI